MDLGLPELMLGITAGAFSPIALIAACQMLVRTKLEPLDATGQ